MNFSPRFVPNRSGSAKKSPPIRSTSRPLPSWNSYLTDDSYKISEEDLLKKKKMYMSKHNILHDVGSEKIKRTIKKKIVKKQPSVVTGKDDDSMVSELEAHDQHVDAIDMLDDEVDEEDSRRTNKENHQSSNSTRPNFCSTVNTKSSGSPRDVMRLHNTPTRTASSSSYFNHYNSGTNTHQRAAAAANSSACHMDDDSAASTGPAPVGIAVTHGLDNGAALDEDLEDILAQIELLTSEMQYYEELSGRKTIFNFEDMKQELVRDVQDGGCVEVEGSLAAQFIQVAPSGKRTLNQKKLMRYLVNLVCKSMTYLLQGEVKLQQQVAQYGALEQKVDELAAQVNAKPASFLELSPALSNSGAGAAKYHHTSTAAASSGSDQVEDEDYSRMRSVYDNYESSATSGSSVSRESSGSPHLAPTVSAPPPPPPAFDTPVSASKSASKMFAPRVSAVNTLNSARSGSAGASPAAATTTPVRANKNTKTAKAQPPIFIPSSIPADMSTPTARYEEEEEVVGAPVVAPTAAAVTTPLRMPGTSTTDWLFASSPATAPVAAPAVPAAWTSKSAIPSDYIMSSSADLNKTVDIYNRRSPAPSSSDDEDDEHTDRLSYHPTKPVFSTGPSAEESAEPAPHAPMNVKAVQFAVSDSVSAQQVY